MAGLIIAATTTEVALVATTAKTVIQAVAAANHRIKILRWGVFFDGTSVTAEPVQVRLLRQTTAGTMTSLSPVLVAPAGAAETIQTTAQHSASAEPTAGDVLDVIEVHPQQGYEVIYPMGQEISVPGAGRIGIECTSPATVNVRAKFWIEE